MIGLGIKALSVFYEKRILSRTNSKQGISFRVVEKSLVVVELKVQRINTEMRDNNNLNINETSLEEKNFLVCMLSLFGKKKRKGKKRTRWSLSSPNHIRGKRDQRRTNNSPL